MTPEEAVRAAKIFAGIIIKEELTPSRIGCFVNLAINAFRDATDQEPTPEQAREIEGFFRQ